MKKAAVHTLFSDWKQRPGSHCTCWATALWSFRHCSLSISPGRQQPQPIAVQQLPSQLWSIPDPSLTHGRPIHFSWKVTVWGYTYCGIYIKGFLPLCVPLYRKQTFRKASYYTLIITWGRVLCSLHPFKWPVGRTAWLSWLIFIKNKNKDGRNERKGLGANMGSKLELIQHIR